MENILNKKFHLKSGQILAVINSPAGYLNKLQPLPGNTTFSTKILGGCDFIQYFVTNVVELENALFVCKKAIKEGGSIWVTYPKQSSKIKTDLNRDISFPILQKYGFTGVAMISIDETWTAFRVKPIPDSVAKISNKLKENNSSKYINKEKRIIIPPEDMQKELKKNKRAFELFNSLVFTHKKEYVQWILDAKKEETRNKRIKGTIEMLLKGLKNPSDKTSK